MALSVSNPQSKDPTSTIAKQSSGIPGLGNTILFSPRQFPTFSSGVHVNRPAKRRRLASPPSHGLVFKFGLVSNASRNESSPPSTYEPGRDIALERPKIAQTAQIDLSELSEEAKAIIALAPRTGESTIDRTNTITSPDLSAGTEAVTELKNNSVSGSLLSEESQVRAASVAGSKRRSRNKEYVVAKKEPSTGGQYLQLSKEQRTQRGNATQLAAEMRAKQLVAALAESETDDDRGSTSPGAMTVSGPVVHLPTARGTSLPLTSILKRIGRDPTPTKRVHFLTFDKLVSHTAAGLQRYTDTRTSGPVLSMSFSLAHASFLNPLLTPATLINALEHFQGLVGLLLIELNRFMRAAETKQDDGAMKAELMAIVNCQRLVSGA
ncbi:hypothetical protein M438DRAFT_340311 [Aureobasidium pullulans EXF-150]|uniref:Uncharacterized protein n=1 Tax=Aureobasidium pullulans EXF-150 TaxID=1043002 RepID=A0A074X500_AURPU|nr:uncharacterized protein M438DRAFT_340311 [Aureobasidium pullulans EXF-150]KEQ78864.1 hypothetical protein M438DRAFT_340311 [Aureobasidium pullulans EXF-150]